jgi:hypothetical protein
VLATNENDVLDEFFRTGRYRVRTAAETHETSSPSMDISKASNFERFIWDVVGGDGEKVAWLWNQVEEKGGFDISTDSAWEKIEEDSGFVSGRSTHEDRIATIRLVKEKYGEVIDPHTADGVKIALRVREARFPMICLETALPAKFESTIVEALGAPPPRPARFEGIERRREERMPPIPFASVITSADTVGSKMRARSRATCFASGLPPPPACGTGRLGASQTLYAASVRSGGVAGATDVARIAGNLYTINPRAAPRRWSGRSGLPGGKPIGVTGAARPRTARSSASPEQSPTIHAAVTIDQPPGCATSSWARGLGHAFNEKGTLYNLVAVHDAARHGEHIHRRRDAAREGPPPAVQRALLSIPGHGLVTAKGAGGASTTGPRAALQIGPAHGRPFSTQINSMSFSPSGLLLAVNSNGDRPRTRVGHHHRHGCGRHHRLLPTTPTRSPSWARAAACAHVHVAQPVCAWWWSCSPSRSWRSRCSSWSAAGSNAACR